MTVNENASSARPTPVEINKTAVRLLIQSLADGRIIGGKGSVQYRRMANKSARDYLAAMAISAH